MAYQKQNFVDGEILKASHLNHIEDAVARLDSEVESQSKELSKVNENALAFYHHKISISCEGADVRPYVEGTIHTITKSSAPLQTVDELYHYEPNFAVGYPLTNYNELYAELVDSTKVSIIGFGLYREDVEFYTSNGDTLSFSLDNLTLNNDYVTEV